MALDNAPGNIEETISDRDILLHIMERVEYLYAMLGKYEAMLLGPNGKVDMVGAAQLRRRMRRGT